MTLINGVWTLDTATGQLSGHVTDGPLPPDPPVPPSGDDMIDLADAVITSESINVKGWTKASKLGSLLLSENGDMDVDFDKRWRQPEAWPFVIGSEGGEIQYTLWIGCLIAGLWYVSGIIRCISRSENDNYCPTGPVLRPGHLSQNCYYFAGSPLATYQPQPGEPVAWFLTSGDQRRGDIHAITERTQVVVAPFLPGVWTF